MLCGKCKIDKPTTEFCRSSKRSSGYQFWCKACTKISSIKYAKKNRAKLNEKAKARYYENREKYQTPEYRSMRKAITESFHARHPDYRKYKYKRDKNRLGYWFNAAIGGMRQRSKRKGFPPPEINNREVLEQWARANNLDLLWAAFVSSNFDPKFKPSIDRLDNSKPYTVDNMRLVTWRENLDSWNKGGNIEHGRKTAKFLVESRKKHLLSRSEVSYACALDD